LWKFYYEKGNIFEEVEYGRGLPDGKKVTYFEFGGIMIKGSNKKGLQDGTWIYYDQKGNELRKVKFRDGKKEN
jgi:antitoxin component YwqK of YwqJK toxin-antitoxin module